VTVYVKSGKEKVVAVGADEALYEIEMLPAASLRDGRPERRSKPSGQQRMRKRG